MSSDNAQLYLCPLTQTLFLETSFHEDKKTKHCVSDCLRYDYNAGVTTKRKAQFLTVYCKSNDNLYVALVEINVSVSPCGIICQMR